MSRKILAALALGLCAAAPTSDVRVVDGDTLVLGGETVRLWGVDAPEGRQSCRDSAGAAYPCGDRARAQLRALAGDGIVTCQERDRDGYGRTVAQCRVGGVDLGEALVRAGWAVDYRQFSQGVYSRAEAEARRARRGLWAGQFRTPGDWRSARRGAQQATRPPRPPPGRCIIKANINAKGRRIFHSPGQQDYASTVIDTGRGERWFCSPAEARAAGWAPAQR